MHKYKVAVLMITLNQPYWQYTAPCIESLKKFLLKGHEVDFLLWSDMPVTSQVGATKIFPTESMAWPIPTLMRYHLFLRQEETLRDYDYLLYCDSDMLAVSRIDDEILGEGLTIAQHPMYAIRRDYFPPYEPNPESRAFIPRLGRIVEQNGKKRLDPIYAAGGFQGGRTEEFISAMHTMKGWIDEDFANNYVPIWNDESIWNAYLFRMTSTGILPNSAVVLSPEYIYPDSLNKSYYQRAWGRNFVPKLITLTKPFSLSKEGGAALQTTLNR